MSACHGGAVRKHSRTVRWWRLSYPQQVAALLVTSNAELDSSVNHRSFETLVGLDFCHPPSGQRWLRLPGLPTMVVFRTTPARTSTWGGHLHPTNFPGGRYNQKSIYRSSLSGQALSDQFAPVLPSARLQVVWWTCEDESMLPKYLPSRKRIRNRLSTQYNLHREAHCSVLCLDENNTGVAAVTHTVQVTMDDWKRMHCGGVILYEPLVVITVTHGSLAHWQCPTSVVHD